MSSERFRLKAAVYLMPIKEEKVLLSRRFNTGWMDGQYSLIAGHLDGNEKASIAMIREAFEEAGIKIDNNDLIPVKVVHRHSADDEYIDFFFITKKWEGEPKIMETDKCDDLSWFAISELPENILPHVRQVLESYRNNIPLIESGWE